MFTPVVAQTSAAPEKLFAQGAEALKNGRLDEAEKFLQEAQKSGGESILILHNLAVIQQQRGEHPKAVAQFREVIRLQPDNGTAHLLLGISLTALDKNAEALTALHKAAKFLPQQSEVRWQLAKAYERLDAWSGVIEQYQLLSELEPGNAEYAYQLGRAYNKLAEWSQLEIIRLNPNAARIHQALGQNYLVQGRHDLALLSFQKAAKADPKLTEIHLAIALILLEQKLYEEALREIALELKLVPESIKALEVKKQIESARQSGQ
jgi:tetratricopeptide (TPR) repeat protein